MVVGLQTKAEVKSSRGMARERSPTRPTLYLMVGENRACRRPPAWPAEAADSSAQMARVACEVHINSHSRVIRLGCNLLSLQSRMPSAEIREEAISSL